MSTDMAADAGGPSNRPAPDRITSWDVLWCWWKFKLTQYISISNPTRTGPSYVYALSSILKKLYKNEEDLNEALLRHSEFFMTRYSIGGAITGMVIALEERRAKDLHENGYSEVTPESIRATKTSLMGPFAGLGDPVETIVFYTPALVIATPMAIQGNFWALPVFFVFAVLPDWVIGSLTYHWGYTRGKDFVVQLTESKVFERVLYVGAILGMALFGALTFQLVKFSTPGLVIRGTSLTDHINSIVPGLSALIPVALVYYLFERRKVPAVLIVVLLVVIGVVLSMLGAFDRTASAPTNPPAALVPVCQSHISA